MFRILLILGVLISGITLAVVPSPSEAQPVAVDEPLYTPDSSVKFALGDLLTLPDTYRPYIRYLSLYNYNKTERVERARIVSFTINSLSRRKTMYIPVFVGASNATVIRINLKDYDIDPKEWDNLGAKGSGPKPFPEPYFHAHATDINSRVVEHRVTKTRQVPTGQYVYNQQGQIVPQMRNESYEVIEKTEAKGTGDKVLVRAPWCDNTSLKALEDATHSEFPIMRADWFVVYSMVEPAYHLLLGLGETEKTFEQVVFADEALAEKARSQHKGVVIKSSVARQNRTLVRSPTFTNGYIWRSHDTLRAVDDRNYAQNILNEKFDAKEIIATLPNGLQAYLVTNGEGKRLDKADNEIATDYMAADKIVRNGRSCVYCHVPGINPIQDEVRTINKKLTNREQVMLLVSNEEDAYKVQDLFSSNLDKQIVRDQQIYADAIGEATGSTPQEIASGFFHQWENYAENLLTKEVMARDLGMSQTDLDRYARLSNDPLFLGIVHDPIRPVRRDQFERSFQDFLVLVMRAKVSPPGQQHTSPTIILDPNRKD